MTPPLRVERVVLREIRPPLKRPFEIASDVTVGLAVSPPTMVEEARDAGAEGYRRIRVKIAPGRVGGFAPSLAIHALCRGAGIPMWCGGMFDTGLGRACNAALASLSGFELPSDIYPPARYLVEDIVRPVWSVAADGTVPVPGGASGAGVELDRDRVEELTVWKEEP